MTHSSKPRHAITNRLWRYRKAQQLSQKQVAQLLGHRTTAHISRWENGAKIPTLDSALKLAHILKAPVEALFADRTAELHTEINRRASKAPALHHLVDHDHGTRPQAA